MTENPQKENGYTAIANEIVDVLARTKFTTQEGRFIWAVFRKTYGFNKKEDWISLTQISEMTGMSRAHASHTKSRLIGRRIVAQTGNKIQFNKFYSQWRELPKLATVARASNKVAYSGNSGVAYSGNGVLPKQATTKVDITKDNITKDNNVVINKKLLHWLGQHGKKKGYALWLYGEFGNTVDKAWEKAKSQQDIKTPSDFVELCKKLE